MTDNVPSYRPITLTNGAMVMREFDGLFYACDIEDVDLLPEQGPERTEFVLTHLLEETE